MVKRELRVLVATGSSGGHVFPALSFIDALRETHPSAKSLLVVPQRHRIDARAFAGYDVRFIPFASLHPKLCVKNLFALFELVKASVASFFIFVEFRPQVVVGFGSLAALPSVLYGWFFRAKTVIHEQNVSPGLANRVASYFADKIALSFRQTEKYFGHAAAKLRFTGNLLRKELRVVKKEEARRFFHLSEALFTILVMGGSQGSRAINRAFLESLASLGGTSFIQIIHLTGMQDYEPVRQAYEQLNVACRVFPFLQEMQYAYSASDIVIGRAGATTIAELAFFGSPAILVPYPFASRHQLENALLLERAGCAVLIEEDKLSSICLSKALGDFLRIPERINSMKKHYEDFPSIDSKAVFLEEVFSA